jgi:hypothetical protein
MDIIAIVFPRVYIVCRDVISCVFSGIIFRRWQTLPAAEEIDKDLASFGAIMKEAFAIIAQIGK